MKLILILTSLFSLFFLNSCKFFEEHPLFNKGPDSLLNMPVVEPKPMIADTTPIFEEETTISTAPKVQMDYGNDKYFMVVGSFQNENFAELYAEKIQKMGYQSQIFEASNGFYRVSAKSYNNFQEGVRDIENFRTAITTGAWLNVRN